MTPELAQTIVDQGIPDNLTRLYTVIKSIYSDYTAQEFAAMIAYVRAETTIAEEAERVKQELKEARRRARELDIDNEND